MNKQIITEIDAIEIIKEELSGMDAEVLEDILKTMGIDDYEIRGR